MRWVLRHLGYRGIALILLGCNWALIGAQLASETARKIDPDAAILHELIPTPVRVWLWVGCGAAAITCALANRLQGLGFALALVMPVERAVSHAWSWQAHVVPGEPGGAPDAWALSLRWLVIVALVLLMSRWREGSDARIELTRQEAA